MWPIAPKSLLGRIMPGGTLEAPRLNLSCAKFSDLANTILLRHFGAPFFFYNPDTAPPYNNVPNTEWTLSQTQVLAPLARQCLNESRVVVRPVSNRLQALVIPLKCAN